MFFKCFCKERIVFKAAQTCRLANEQKGLSILLTLRKLHAPAAARSTKQEVGLCVTARLFVGILLIFYWKYGIIILKKVVTVWRS